eukprot:4538694-Pyramimonas_sp.AAC.1
MTCYSRARYSTRPFGVAPLELRCRWKFIRAWRRGRQRRLGRAPRLANRPDAPLKDWGTERGMGDASPS